MTGRPTMADDLSGALFELVADVTMLRWPSPRFRADPVGFARNVLGIDPWEAQRQVLESVRDNPRTTWKSGHRVAKSNTGGIVSCWFYGGFDDARVIMSAPTARQVDGILWRETQKLVRQSGICLDCRRAGKLEHSPCPHSAKLDGKLGKRAATGLTAEDFREIRGYTAKDVESITGTAGKNLLFVFDECSGIPEEIFEGLEGNRAGWSEDGEGTVRVLYTGNPTRTSGEFYNSFNSKKKFFHCVTTSSEDTPNCKTGKVIIPGLATRQWCEEKAEMWGPESALYLIRVKGEFAESEDGKIFSVDTITRAEERWDDTPGEGRLWLGIDPAGESGTGDEAAFAPRRGLRILDLIALQINAIPAHLTHALGILEEHKLPRERPVVVLDVEGAVGAKVYGVFLQHLEQFPEAARPFEFVAVRASERAGRQPHVYERVREELTANFESWIRDGGAIVSDTKLAAEMHVWEWEQQVNGRLRLVPRKRELRKKNSLGRSPDRYDACTLSTWEPLRLKDGVPESALAQERDDDDDFAEATFDPYDSHKAWKP